MTNTSCPTRGSIWQHNNSGVEVQIIGPATIGRVSYRYLRGKFAGTGASLGVKFFRDEFTEVDLMEAQHPKVVAGQVWWSRTHRLTTVTVLSVVGGVVTFKYGDGGDPVYAADSDERFLSKWTNEIKPVQPEQDWPTHAYFTVSNAHGVIPSRFAGFEWSDGNGEPIIKVPIDWSKAVWEVEPR